MSDFKKNLIRLGSTNPELRPHIRAVLREAGKTPQLIEDPREIENLVGPIDLESEGGENVYFTDGYGDRYFMKDPSGRDRKRLFRYFRNASKKTAKKIHFDLSDYAEAHVEQVALLASNNYGPWKNPQHAEMIVQKAVKDYAKSLYRDVTESFGPQDIKHIVEAYMYQDESDPYGLEPPDKAVGKKIESLLKKLLGNDWGRFSGTRADKGQHYRENNKAWQVWIEGHPSMDVDSLWRSMSKELGRGFDVEIQDNVTLLVIPRED